MGNTPEPTPKPGNSSGIGLKDALTNQFAIIIGAIGLVIVGMITDVGEKAKIWGRDTWDYLTKTPAQKLIGTWQLPTGAGSNLKIYEITAAQDKNKFLVKDYQVPSSGFISNGMGSFVGKDSAVVRHTRNYINQNHEACTVEVLLQWKFNTPDTFDEKTRPTPENINNEWQCELKTAELINSGSQRFTRKQ